MKTKSLSSAWWKITLALVAIIPCLFIFTACGGETIENAEAITAVNNAAEEMVSAQNFTVERITRVSGNADGISMKLNSTERISVNNGAVELSVRGDAEANGNMGGVNMNLDYNMDNTVKLAKIDGQYYIIKDSTSEKDSLYSTDFNEYLSLEGIIEYFTLLSEDIINPTDVDANITTDFKKVGDNSYNLTLTQEMETQGAVTNYGRMYYEIRDGALTKFVFESEASSDDGTTTLYVEYKIGYTSNEISLPTAEELAEYKDSTIVITIPTPEL